MRCSRKIVVGMLAAATLVVAPLAVAAPAGATAYSNCKALNADYPHGVGQSGAVDSTSGTPVTNFTVNDNVYRQESSHDRDKDGIACERH
ncbi:excalibur calcium-binding domain-containing protein [Gordonia sp. SL306]|uniref:excalibur calcium-binding domain-containing protein n=1 Tax=Gordonia sp. SL306 TaxID=2995145 RepID=UPI00226D5BDE|nr:excalibur calcium-binding domain-containing protein [Gordonia sp. SL306]WAC56711.1 excalibur calcium-binding domain-containing protein [Gordonia sp. SL306]